MGFKNSNISLRRVIAYWCGFFQDPRYISETTFSFSGSLVGIRQWKPKQAEIQPASVSFSKAPGPSLELLSSGIRSLPSLYSNPLMSSWSKAAFLVYPSHRLCSLVQHLSETLAFYIAALLFTAFSFLFTIYCSLVCMPRVYHWRLFISSPWERQNY